MKTHAQPFIGFLFCCLFASTTFQVSAHTTDWNVAALDQILAGVQPGQKLVTMGDMQILVANLATWRNQLAGTPSPKSAFDGVAPHWTGGNVYYNFSTDGATAVATNLQKAFLDGAAEWSMFANVHFIPRTTQANYVTIQLSSGLEGGQSVVGMAGGQQFLSIGPNAWNRYTICHELGHTLGLVHEHQRSNRDSYVTILTNNVEPGTLGNFVILSDSLNESAYDFLSVMHYARNEFSVSPSLDTIEPLPAYTRYLNIMGVPGPIVLSALDRAGMTAIYGVGPVLGPIVTNTLDSGPGSLRAALYYAFDHPNTRITFNIPTNDPGYVNGVFTIQPTDQLPWLVNATVLEGASQPTNAFSNPNGPQIQINGSLAPTPDTFASGLVFGGSNCVAHALVINGFAEESVLLQGSNTTGNVVAGCYLGIDPTGSFAVPNSIVSALINQGAHGNIIGGIAVSNRNVISGSVYQGLVIQDSGTTNNVVEGNYIGLNAAGTGAIPNTWSGVAIYGGAQNNFIGGTFPGARNVISGNALQGLTISDTNSTGNVVEGNYIGLDPSGTQALSNGWAGINIFGGAQSNLVGGTVPGARNIISGNTLQGVAISDTNSSANEVEGNYIGLDPAGTTAIPNGYAGVEIFGGATGNFIGGAVSGAGNVISGNLREGVAVDETGSSLNVIQGNIVGLDPTGSQVISNTWSGIGIFDGAQSNLIGGPALSERNVVSGNGNQGIVIGDAGANNNVVEGNFVGLDVTGVYALPNTWAGVEVFGGAQNNLIGGIAPGAGNVISGNGIQGVALDGAGTAGNLVQGNLIGLNAAGTAAIANGASGIEMYYNAQNNLVGGPGARNYISGNGNYGVAIDTGCNSNVVQGNTIGLNPIGNGVPNNYAGVAMFGGASWNLIGGTTLGAANLIAGNLSDGIQVFDSNSLYETLRGNSITGNNGYGIGLYNGANGSPSTPVLNSAVVTTNTTVNGTLAGLPNTTFHLDFYANSPTMSPAQAQIWFGTRDVTTAGNGNASFSIALLGPVPIGKVITVSATDPSGNTSSLSVGVPVSGTDSIGDGITDAWRQAHFGGSGTTNNSLSCATCDPDHDGMNNLQEFLAGTDPNNTASVLRMADVSQSGQDILVSFPSVLGITYRVEYKNSLSASDWSLFSDQILGTGGLIQLDDPGVGAFPEGFFRLDVLP